MKNILKVANKLTFDVRNNVEFPFIGEANLWIENTFDEEVLQFGQYLIMKALTGTTPGQIQLIGYDSELSGMFAPFSLFSSGESKLLEFIDNKQELVKTLLYLKQHIQSVQNVIQGRRPDLTAFRKHLGKAIESYKLIVLLIDVGLVDKEIKALLAMLLKAGPSAGVSFVIISTTEDVKPIQFADNIVELTIEKSVVKETVSGKVANFTPYSAHSIIDRCALYSKQIQETTLPSINFNEINPIDCRWSETSHDGVTFSVGKYGLNTIDITIGDEINQRHNALITGAVGQGKSNLISVIIHSLCQRYSPKELNLYLLDFKEGVTLKVFSNIDQDEYLPHAKALGLESDTDFGYSVLEFLYDEYKRRLKLFKDASKKGIKEYREEFPEVELPRIVVIIDEFQLMFGDDNQKSQKIAEMLEKSVRLFRAAGIHFILASQTIGGNPALYGKTDSIFSQIPIRIAHKNSASESQLTLGMGNTGAVYLKPREAIVNLDYGEISQNRKTIIGYADESILSKLRKKWWLRAKNYSSPPFVFESNQNVSLSNSLQTIEKFRNVGTSFQALIGTRISVVENPVNVPLLNENGRNILILGANDNTRNSAIGIIESIAVSLAVQHKKGNGNFIFINFLGEDLEKEVELSSFFKLLEQLGAYVELVQPPNFYMYIQNLTKHMQSNDNQEIQEKTYIFGLGMDKWKNVQDEANFSFDPPLKEFLEAAPNYGIHFIGWWVKASFYQKHVTGISGSGDAFNTKIFLRIDERSVQSLTTPFVKWHSQSNRAMLYDDIEFSEEIVFKPYSPVTTKDCTVFSNKIWE